MENNILIAQGAEARVFSSRFLGRPTIIKERFSKKYRHPQLDKLLTHKRLKTETRCIIRAKKARVASPLVYYVDLSRGRIYMEYIKGQTVKKFLHHATKLHTKTPCQPFSKECYDICAEMGKLIARLHNDHIIHGDLTTSNFMLREREYASIEKLVVIDFGLGYISANIEDMAVDLYVLERAFISTHPNSESLNEIVLDSYRKESNNANNILNHFEKVRLRGRKRLAFG